MRRNYHQRFRTSKKQEGESFHELAIHVSSRKQCFNCERMDHLVKDCPKKPVRSDLGREGQPGSYNCHKVGHVAMQCPANALAVTEEVSDQNMLCSRIVQGQQVDDILLDTGCSRTLVHQRLIPLTKYLPKHRSIKCVHGDTQTYQLAEVGMEINGVKFTMEVAVAETLPKSVLLGTDAPILLTLLSQQCTKPFNSEELGVFAVTRAQARKEIEEEHLRLQQEVESEVQFHQLNELNDNIHFLFDDEQFGTSRTKETKSRNHKRRNHQQHWT